MSDALRQADGFRLGTRPTDDDVDTANRLINALSTRIAALEAAVKYESDVAQQAIERAEAAEAERDKLREAVDMEATRLGYFCNLVNAGKAQGGGREFSRQIGHAFDRLKSAFAETEGW